ncbi:FAD-binding oxidoreductase [Paracoccus sp. TK19116]|uniref:FAD-binding oxidoreductase n=1 Tax=Paracoccus albicereus TaxID=2922394 RepID=A0ABT1MSJ0_9RHOB|nr:FAD-dependent oxidoreductase [Paracoccus albicereus]MCQ0971267.1 FAD-binding oxidoreductase [Paracoccus albicereus]
MRDSADAIIIGAGVIGNAIAFELAKLGWQTLSLDKGPDAGSGSTSSSSAIIRTYYSVEASCALAYEGWHYWRDWAAHVNLPEGTPLIRYNETGCLVVKGPANKNLVNVCAMMDRIGCPWQDVPAERIADYLPGVDLQAYYPPKRPEDDGFCVPTGREIAGAVFFPQGGYVNDPKLAAENLKQAAEAHGARFLFRAAVAEMRQADGRTAGVTLADGRQIDAPVVINAGGPWSSKLNDLAGVTRGMNIATRANRQEVAYIPGPRDFDFGAKGYVYSDGDTETYARPEAPGVIVIGSGDPQCDPREWVDDPDALDTNFTDQWTTNVMRFAQRFPNQPIPGQAKGVVAMYDVSDDWLPIYDCSDLPGFYMACGTSGNQFKNAPVAGKIMARIVTACEDGHDHDADPLSFHLDRIDRSIDLSTYSRKRVVNPNSSFSVIG